MDLIDLFVDHFVIHSKSRKALVLNASSADVFKESLRDLVDERVRNTLLERVKILDGEISLTEPHRRVSPQHDRLVDARTAIMDLHNELLWNDETTRVKTQGDN